MMVIVRVVVAVWLLGYWELIDWYMFFFRGFLSHYQSHPQSLDADKGTEITEPPFFANESFPKRA
jgi:hypothetical protein